MAFATPLSLPRRGVATTSALRRRGMTCTARPRPPGAGASADDAPSNPPPPLPALSSSSSASSPSARNRSRPRPPPPATGTPYTVCTSCAAAFILPSSAVARGGGRLVACGVCTHTWFQSPRSLLRLDAAHALVPYPPDQRAAIVTAAAARSGQGISTWRSRRRGAPVGVPPAGRGRVTAAAATASGGGDSGGDGGTAVAAGTGGTPAAAAAAGTARSVATGTAGTAGTPVSSSSSSSSSSSLFLTNLPWATDAADVVAALAGVGVGGVTASEVRLLRSRATGLPRGMAFVLLRSSEEEGGAATPAQLAATVAAADGMLLDGRPVTVRVARNRETGRDEGVGGGS